MKLSQPKKTRVNGSDDEFITLANRPWIEKWEAIQIVQGFCPNMIIADGGITYMDDYADQAKKINQAELIKQLLFPIKPTDFVRWCDKNNVCLPDIFSNTVSNKLIKLHRPKNLIDTDELIKGSSSDQLNYLGRLKPGRKVTKHESTICGYETKVIMAARKFCLDHILAKGTMPLKKTINDYLSKKLNRKEVSIDRAYTLTKIITLAEFNRARKRYRANRYQKLMNKY